MRVFLETDRLVLRQFTLADVDNLVGLDSDPGVMRFVTGGQATPRDEIVTDFLPAFLSYYERFAGYGFWAAIEKGFTEVGVQRVVAETMAVQAASRRVMEKAGVSLARSFRQPWPYPMEGDEHGDVEYSLTRAEWERQEAAGPAGDA